MRAYINWKKIQKIINLFCCSKRINLNLPRSEIPHVGIVFLGRESTRKSTIMGHYLYLSALIQLHNQISQEQNIRKIFRMVFHSTYKIRGIETVSCEKVMSGMLFPGRNNNIQFLPIFDGRKIKNLHCDQIIRGKIKSMEGCYEPIPWISHENIGINIRGVSSSHIKGGYKHSACGIV